MKVIMLISLFAAFGVIHADESDAFNPEEFAQDYFKAWTATQNPKASKEDIEHYLSFLTDDERHPDNLLQ